MTQIITFMFDKIYTPLWAVIRSNVYLSWSVVLALIAGVITIYKSLQTK